jgi:hypothetical protein
MKDYQYMRTGIDLNIMEFEELNGISPRYCWNGIPDEIKQEIIKYNLKWNWFEKYLSQELRIPESRMGYRESVRTSFFVMYSKGS